MSGNSLLMANNTKLRHDGVYLCDTLDQVIDCMLNGIPTQSIYSKIPEVVEFNNKVDTRSEFATGDEKPLSHDWMIPSFYQNLDIYGYVLHKLDEYIDPSSPEYANYMDRISLELEYLESTNSLPFIQCIVFLLDEMTSRGMFWGVGRGSSCASLVLFVIGLHKIDPIIYKIPLSDFFK